MLLTDAYTEFLLAHDYQPATTRYYQQRLGHLMRWLSNQAPPVTTVAGLSTTLIRRYLDERKTQPSARTGKMLDSYSLYSTARGILAWLNWLVAEELLDANIPKRIKPPRREQKVLHVLDKRQIERLFIAADADASPTALRDRAILSVLLDTGIRANELCSLERDDVHLTPDDGYLLIRKGKGRRQREVPLGKKARLALARYLRSHTVQAVFPGTGEAPLTIYG
ncbi:MAG: tyrosine-type recombinase/integrase, partial [Ktedonobacterales bacterium]